MPMTNMVYKVPIDFDVKKGLIEKIILRNKKNNVKKQEKHIYLHLMVMLHQWLPTKEQHYF